MKRSPLSTPSGSNRRRHTPYNWNSHDNTSKRGYPPNSNGGGNQCFSANDGTQQTGDDFIPLDMSTPVTQYKKNNWHSPRGGRNNSSPDSGGCYNRNSYSVPRSKYNNTNARCNYRNNYYTPSRSSSNSSFSPYKQPFRQFNNQRKRGRGAHRQVSISEYVDMRSCLEDPWEHLMKKLNNSKDTDNDETPQTESSFNLKLLDSDFTEKPENKLPRDNDLNDSRCSQESKLDSSLDTTFEENMPNVSQTSKASSSIDLKISSICFNQDSVEKSTSSINDSAAGATEEKDNAHLDKPVADTDEKNI